MLDSIQDAPLRGVVVIPHAFEHIDSAVKRFKKATDKSNVLKDHRRHDYFVTRTERRRQKDAAARKRRGG